MLAILFTLLLHSASAHPPERSVEIQALATTIQEGIGITEPYYSGSVPGSIFRTSFDWHSSVHAHWALLSIARVTGNKKLEEFVFSRLTPQALQLEESFLREHPGFEMPYGRAWLLLLLNELEKRHLSWPVMRSLREQTERELLKYLSKEPFPEYGKQFSAAHDSWLMAYTLFSLSQPASDLKRELETLRQNRLDPSRDAISWQAYTDWDFIYLPALVGVIDSTRTYSWDGPPPFRSPVTSENAHASGAQALRLWPFAVACSQGGEMECSHLDSRLKNLMEAREQWDGGFAEVSHWVPQFIWMAIWLERGRP